MATELTSEEVAIMIRARQLFREKGLSPNADISEICEAAGISRKTGYQWVEKHSENAIEQQKALETELTRMKAEHARLKKEFDEISLENRGRKLAWEIHGIDAYLASKKKHYEQPEKEKAISFFRNEGITLQQLAWLLILPIGTLSGWNQGFDQNMTPYVTEDHRGKSTKVSIDVVRQVVEAARASKKRLRLKPFVKMLKQDLNLDLSRKTVEQILIANNLWNARTRKKRPRFYQSLKQRIPGGLVSLDGSELVVWINDRAIKFNVELAVDVSTFCHTGFSIDAGETADAVIGAIMQHQLKWGNPLGVIFDHGSANLSEAVGNYLDKHGIEAVAVGPGNPKGNGTDEGAFSQMKRILGEIRLDASSPDSLAKGVLENIIGVYVQMRNNQPIQETGGTPALNMQCPVTDQQKETERQRIANHKAKRNHDDVNQPKIDRLNGIIAYHGLNPEPLALKRAFDCICYYELTAIADAEKAFLKAVSRDGNRKTLPYFFGILKNIQQQLDDARYQEYCNKRYNQQVMLETERYIEQKQQKPDPPTVTSIVKMAATFVTAKLRSVKKVAIGRIREWIAVLLKGKKYIGPLKKQIVDAIGSLKDLNLNQQQQVWDVIQSILDPTSTTESVTQFS